MKRFCLALSFALLLLFTFGCEKKEYAQWATYGKIVCNKAAPRVGDTITFTVEVLDPGNRIYHADYMWICRDQFSEEVRVTAPDGTKSITKAPTFKWVFKSAGTYTITMNARFKFSMPDEDGAMMGGASATGSVRIREKY